jgi:hypothetical protein
LKNKGPGILFWLIAIFVTASPAGRAQVNDAGLWTDFTLEKKISKDLDFIFTQQTRFNENITEVGTFYFEAGPEYRFIKVFKVGLFYRFINKRRLDDGYSQGHRIFLDLSYRKKIRRFQAGYRIRFQIQYMDYRKSETGSVPSWDIRQKIHLEYNTKSRFDPYLDGEIWYNINPVRSRFDNLRICTGIVTRITKNHFIDTGYIFQKEFNVVNPETDYIVYLGYKISL